MKLSIILMAMLAFVALPLVADENAATTEKVEKSAETITTYIVQAKGGG